MRMLVVVIVAVCLEHTVWADEAFVAAHKLPFSCGQGLVFDRISQECVDAMEYQKKRLLAIAATSIPKILNMPGILKLEEPDDDEVRRTGFPKFGAAGFLGEYALYLTPPYRYVDGMQGKHMVRWAVKTALGSAFLTFSSSNPRRDRVASDGAIGIFLRSDGFRLKGHALDVKIDCGYPVGRGKFFLYMSFGFPF